MDSDKDKNSERQGGHASPGSGETTRERHENKYALSPEEMRLLDEIHSESLDESRYFDKLLQIRQMEAEKRQAIVKRALGKFNVFLHLTAYLTGMAYLLLLGLLVRSTLPYVFIPIGLWTIGIGYHFYWAFLKKDQETRRSKKRGKPSAPPGMLPGDAADEPAPLERPDDEKDG
jgi:hypothetical protein